MQPSKIAVYAHVYDQGDMLREYLDWYLELGVDLILVQDNGSTDGSHDVLDEYARRGLVKWFVLPERDMRKYNSGDTAVHMLLELGAEWIIQCDGDEFLQLASQDLRETMQSAKEQSHTVINISCFNMTGPLKEGGDAPLRHLTLRIDRPKLEMSAERISDDLPVPYVFIQHPIKAITYAPAYKAFAPGSHGAKTEWGTTVHPTDLCFFHYPFRGFDVFEQKIRNATKWLQDNPHLPPWWGWHWRRWIRLHEAGLLRNDYEAQFVTPELAQVLIDEGTCSLQLAVATWAQARVSRYC